MIMMPSYLILAVFLMILLVIIFVQKKRQEQELSISEIQEKLDNRQYEDAITLGQELLSHNPPADLKCEIMCIVGIALFRLNQNQEAKELLEQSITISHNIGYFSIEAKSNYWLGRALVKLGHDDEAIKYYLKGLELSRVSNDDTLRLFIANSLGYVWLRTGRALEAKKLLLEAIESSLNGSDFAFSLCYNTLGAIEHALGNNDDAIDCYNQSLQYLEDDLIGVSIALNNIANIFLEMGLNDEALSYYYRALEVSEKANDDEGIAYVLRNIAELLENRGDFDQALEHLNRAKIHFERARIPPVEVFLSLAYLMTKMDRIDRALEYISELEEYGSHLEKNYGWYIRYHLIKAEIQMKQYHYDDAFQILCDLKEDSRINNMVLEHMFLLLLETQLFLKSNDLDKALDTLLTIEQKALDMKNVVLIWHAKLAVSLIDVLNNNFDTAEERISSVIAEAKTKNHYIAENARLLLERSKKTRTALAGYDVADKISKPDEDFKISKDEVSDYISSVKNFVSELGLIN